MGPRIGPAGDGSSGAFERAGLAEHDEVGEAVLRVRPERSEEIESLRLEGVVSEGARVTESPGSMMFYVR
jgi:hypothetical protein